VLSILRGGLADDPAHGRRTKKPPPIRAAVGEFSCAMVAYSSFCCTSSPTAFTPSPTCSTALPAALSVSLVAS